MVYSLIVATQQIFDRRTQYYTERSSRNSVTRDKRQIIVQRYNCFDVPIPCTAYPKGYDCYNQAVKQAIQGFLKLA